MRTSEEINTYHREYYHLNKERNKEKQKERQNRYREKHKEAILERNRLRYKDSHTKKMLYHARCRATKYEVPFDLELSDIFVPEYCPIFKDIKLEVGKESGLDCSPSIDRIVPALGYVKGNIQIISSIANKYKNNATIERLIELGKWAEEFKEKRADDAIPF